MADYKKISSKITVFFTVFTLLASCSINLPSLKIHQIKRQDSAICRSQGFQINNSNSRETEIYWKCRLNLIQDRIIEDSITNDKAIRYNNMIEKIQKEIIENLNKAKEETLGQLDDDFNINDHNKCLIAGYTNKSNNPRKVNDYYRCRENLILSRNPTDPRIVDTFKFKTQKSQNILQDKEKFEKYITRLFQKNSRGDQDAKNLIKAIAQYPQCANENYRTEKFKLCIRAQEKAEECVNKIEEQKIIKQLNDRIFCQKQAYVQFPDELAIDDIEKIKNQEKLRKNNLLLGYLDPKLELEKQQVEQQKEQIIQNNAKIYTKLELLRIRESFIEKCNQLMVKKINNYIDSLSKNCTLVSNSWQK